MLWFSNTVATMFVPEQMTLASSKWLQFSIPIPLCGHAMRLASVPTQARLSRRMGPVPCPNLANEGALVAVRG